LQRHQWHFRFNGGGDHLARLFVQLDLQFSNKQTNKQTRGRN
jgi:hypothetical protein